MILGVDALNLAADRRGMGRYVRQVLHAFERLGEVEPVLIVRDLNGARILREEFAYAALLPKNLRSKSCDAFWYPWNGIRFKAPGPSALTIHDLFAFSSPHQNWIARRREQAPIRRGIRDATVLTATSSWTAGAIADRFAIDRNRIAVLPAPGDPWWHPVDCEGGAPYVLFVAGPEARKNASMFFAAFERAFAHDPVELVVAGTLSDADELAFSRLRCRRRRVRPNDDELRALYSGAHAVAIPSSCEGLGLPALEAMACGAPVIVSDAAALPETCGGAALLVAPHDVTAWKAALARIISDAALRSDLRGRGFARVAKLNPDEPAKTLLASLRRSTEAQR